MPECGDVSLMHAHAGVRGLHWSDLRCPVSSVTSGKPKEMLHRVVTTLGGGGNRADQHKGQNQTARATGACAIAAEVACLTMRIVCDACDSDIVKWSRLIFSMSIHHMIVLKG